VFFFCAEIVRSVTKEPLTSHGAKQLDYFPALVNGMDVWAVVAVTTMVGFIILLACFWIHQRRVIHCKSSAVVRSIY